MTVVSELEVRKLDPWRMSVRHARETSPDVVDITPNVVCTDTTIDQREEDRGDIVSYSRYEEVAEVDTDKCVVD